MGRAPLGQSHWHKTKYSFSLSPRKRKRGPHSLAAREFSWRAPEGSFIRGSGQNRGVPFLLSKPSRTTRNAPQTKPTVLWEVLIRAAGKGDEDGLKAQRGTASCSPNPRPRFQRVDCARLCARGSGCGGWDWARRKGSSSAHPRPQGPLGRGRPRQRPEGGSQKVRRRGFALVPNTDRLREAGRPPTSAAPPRTETSRAREDTYVHTVLMLVLSSRPCG